MFTECLIWVGWRRDCAWSHAAWSHSDVHLVRTITTLSYCWPHTYHILTAVLGIDKKVCVASTVAHQVFSFHYHYCAWKNDFQSIIPVQSSSVAQLCPTLFDPMNCSMPGLPVHHQLLEFTQTHIHWVGDAIQPSHPLLSPSPPAWVLSIQSIHPRAQFSLKQTLVKLISIICCLCFPRHILL